MTNVQSTGAAPQPVRYALIGCAAGIATTHIRALAQIPSVQIVGMSDIAATAGARRAAEVGSPFFVDHREMLRQTQPDIAVITTPHPFHAAIALDCFEAGAHALVEKPLAVEVAEGDRMIAAAERAGRILAVNFQQRFRPTVERAKAFIDSGELGPLVRVLNVEPWYRTEAYYRSAGWRGTWNGEGGGVLLNQAIHPLDLLCHLAGLPSRVWGWTRTLKHSMECEDTAQAMMEFPNGAPGYFVTSTIEAGVQRRLQIAGEKATLELVGDQLLTYRLTPPLMEHMLTSPELFKGPAVEVESITLPGEEEGHVALHRDLNAAIREARQPRVTGAEGLKSLELANAIILSSYSGRPVDIPVDRAAYTSLLRQLKRE